MTTNIAAELREIASNPATTGMVRARLRAIAHTLEAQQAAEHRLTIQRPDGTYGKKTMAEMLPDDMVVFDGPESELELLRAGEKFYRAAYEAAQAKIDALMLEYCPDEMTLEQTAEWAAHQKPAPEPEGPQHRITTKRYKIAPDEATPLSTSMFASKANYDKAMGDTVPCNAPTDLTEQPVEVVYTHREDWHAFTSPQLPGLWVSSKSLREACADVEPSIKLPQRLNAGETPTDLTEWQRELMRLVDLHAFDVKHGNGHPLVRTSRAAIESHAAQMVQRVADAEQSLRALAERTEYRGNSVAHIYAKKDAYRVGLDRVFSVLAAAGHPGERDQHVADRVQAALAALQSRCEAAEAKLNTPELHDFATGVVAEAAHQRERWGSAHDAGKEPQDWFWLLGYLGGKVLKAHADGNTSKALHHTISSAAALANWHAAILGAHTSMRPGIDPVARGLTPPPIDKESKT